jgi:anaerobic ribonucleoside-triphosphate reductase activating protein
MRYADITTCDIANGKDFGVVLWCQGCSLNCPGCHNPETHSPTAGKEFTKKEEDLIIKELSKPHIKRFTLSGGHPLEKYNIEACTALCKRIKAELPEISIWCYTGFVWEDISNLDILNYLDVLVDGSYKQDLRTINIPWRGSNNQRVIDVKSSLKNHTLIYYK